MLDKTFLIGCVLIGFALGFFIPFPYGFLASIPAGFIWTDYYYRRR